MMDKVADGFCRRLKALIYKEFLQICRDSSSILIGAILPVVLILLIGYGISLDVKKVPMAVVMEDTSPTAQHALDFLNGSEYFSPWYVYSMNEAKQLLKKREVDAILQVPPDFSEKLQKRQSSLQLILYGVDSTTATAVQSYIEGSVRQKNIALSKSVFPQKGRVVIENRMWFNDANTSTWYFVPGLMMLIMTIVGVFLTALVMAREWERGTLESLFVTPVKLLELLLAKIIPYFCIAMLGFGLCLFTAKFLYEVPIHGSIWIIIFASVLYLFTALGLGLVISAITKSQFLACQVSLIVSFLPALMLTGFLYDLRCVPEWIAHIGGILPSTYYLDLLKSLFLAGNNWTMIIKNCGVLTLYAIFFFGIALKVTKKKVG